MAARMRDRLRRVLLGLGEVVRLVARALPILVCDLAGFAGMAAIAYGAWLIYRPAGFLVGGVLLIAAAMLFGQRLDAKGAR